MKREIANTFQRNGEKNEWNPVNGINRYLHYLSIILFVTYCGSAKAQDFIQGKITKIYSTNVFLIEKEDESTIKVQLNDTEAILKTDSKYGQAIDFLSQTVLNKEIYYTLGNNRNDDAQDVSIIYDCTENDNKTLKNGLPCLSAKPLDIELIKKGYVRYTGDNDYLKKLNSQ